MDVGVTSSSRRREVARDERARRPREVIARWARTRHSRCRIVMRSRSSRGWRERGRVGGSGRVGEGGSTSLSCSHVARVVVIARWEWMEERAQGHRCRVMEGGGG